MYSRGSLKDAPAAYMPAITWTGFYFGVHAGAAFDDSEEDCEFKKDCYAVRMEYGSDDDDDDDDDDTSWLAGLHVGYNWQKPSNWVLGIEGDVSFADDIDYLASLRGRLGYAFGPTLVYATGGVAFLGVDEEFSDDDTITGWVAGLGIEHKLKDSMSIGLEGLYYSFDEDKNYPSYLDCDEDERDFWVVRARLTYHFTDSYAEAPLK